MSTRIQATATLTPCVTKHGDWLLTSGSELDWNLLNLKYADAGENIADVLTICLGDVEIPGKLALYL